MPPDPRRAAARAGTPGGRAEHHQGDDDNLKCTNWYNNDKTLPRRGLLEVDLGHRAGPPPPRPRVSPSSRATADAVLDLERSRHDHVVVARVRAVLAAAMVSLDAGQRPDAVVRRLQHLLEGVLR